MLGTLSGGPRSIVSTWTSVPLPPQATRVLSGLKAMAAAEPSSGMGSARLPGSTTVLTSLRARLGQRPDEHLNQAMDW